MKINGENTTERKKRYYKEIREISENRGVQELLKRIPGWSTRWGLLAVSIVLLAIMPVFFLLEIPLRIKGEVLVTDHADNCTNKSPGMVAVVSFQEKYYAALSGQQQVTYRLTGLPVHEYGEFSMQVNCLFMDETTRTVKLVGQVNNSGSLKLLKGMSGTAEVQMGTVTIARSLTDLWVR